MSISSYQIPINIYEKKGWSFCLDNKTLINHMATMRGGRTYFRKMVLGIIFRKDSVFPHQNIYHDLKKWDFISRGFVKFNSLVWPHSEVLYGAVLLIVHFTFTFAYFLCWVLSCLTYNVECESVVEYNFRMPFLWFTLVIKRIVKCI